MRREGRLKIPRYKIIFQDILHSVITINIVSGKINHDLRLYLIDAELNAQEEYPGVLLD